MKVPGESPGTFLFKPETNIAFKPSTGLLSGEWRNAFQSVNRHLLFKTIINYQNFRLVEFAG